MNVRLNRQWLLALALPLVLTACGDKEPEQRTAFIQFLQTRIIDKPGVHVPKPDADETKAFGPYSADYSVITDFNSGMDESVKPLNGLLQKGAVRSLGDVVARRDDLQAAQAGLNDMASQIKTKQAAADAAHAKLKQPDDLKVVYDKAYERTVSLPSTTFLEVLPQINGTLASSLKVADYVNAHKAQIDVSGPAPKVQDPTILKELNGLLQDLATQAQGAQQAQAKVQAVMLGR